MGMKVCAKCKKEKGEESFHKKTNSKTGKNNVCAICVNEDNRKRKKQLGKYTIDFRIGYVRLNDYCKLLTFLSKMGYDPTKDIHEQFCEKHKLKKKNKPKTNILKWSYKDCFNNEQ